MKKLEEVEAQCLESLKRTLISKDEELSQMNLNNKFNLGLNSSMIDLGRNKINTCENTPVKKLVNSCRKTTASASAFRTKKWIIKRVKFLFYIFLEKNFT